MRLYHYTADSPAYIGSILESGFIRTTESNVSRDREHAGPDVVWLTTNCRSVSGGLRARSSSATRGLYGRKVDIRITVEVPVRHVHRWRDWVAARGASADWISALAKSGGSGTWRVVEREIPFSEWVEVVNTATGEVLYQA